MNLGLRQLDFNADLVLEDGDGDTLKETRKDGTAQEAITATLLEGAYYIRVEAKEQGENEYKLRYGVDEPDPKKVDELREKRRPRDDSLPAIILSKTELLFAEGQRQSESYTVRLGSAPSGTVTVTITGHAGADATPDRTTLTFTQVNWSGRQVVSVTAAEDDDRTDDTLTLTHTATGGGYDGVAASLPVTVRDDDFQVVINEEDRDSALTEGHYSAVDDVCFKLSDSPTGDVTVTLSGHAGTKLAVHPTSVTFVPADYIFTKCFEMSAAPDEDADDEAVTLTLTPSGGGYDGSPARQVQVNVTDLGEGPGAGSLRLPGCPRHPRRGAHHLLGGPHQ